MAREPTWEQNAIPHMVDIMRIALAKSLLTFFLDVEYCFTSIGSWCYCYCRCVVGIVAEEKNIARILVFKEWNI